MAVQGERGFAVSKPPQGHPYQACPPAFPEPGTPLAREEVDDVGPGSEQGGINVLVPAQLGDPSRSEGDGRPQLLAHLFALGDVQRAGRK